MKNIPFLLLVAALLIGCYDDSALWDSVKDHEVRIAELERRCAQINTNITSLQTIITAMQMNDSVTNISPIMENGKEVGYTITFSKSGNITIYHGKNGNNGVDGKDGEDGTDGSTPLIEVMQDIDGIYYWTLNGEWLLDNSGNKIPTTGEDGTGGKDGENGKDGLTPQLKIENGYWYISYDNAASWNQVGKASGEDGEDGIDGDSMFSSITHDENGIYIILSNGTEVTIPLFMDFDINFGLKYSNCFSPIDIPIGILPNHPMKIPFYITDYEDDIIVEVITDNGWSADVERIESTQCHGFINVEVSDPYIDGKVLVFAIGPDGSNKMKSLHFKEGYINGLDNHILNINWHDKSEHSIEYSSNIDFIIRCNEDWLDIPNKYSKVDEIYWRYITAAENVESTPRQTKIRVYYDLLSYLYDSEEYLAEFTVIQGGCPPEGNISFDYDIVKKAILKADETSRPIIDSNYDGEISYKEASMFEDHYGEYDYNGGVMTRLMSGLDSIIGNDPYWTDGNTSEYFRTHYPNGIRFNEFKYFTSVHHYYCNTRYSPYINTTEFPESLISIGEEHMPNDTPIHGEAITLPESIKTINAWISTQHLFIKATTPPVLHPSSVVYFETVYVPDGSVDEYKTSEYWSAYSDRIMGYSF